MIKAKIVLDSVNPQGNRITTWLLTYPRFIHSEFMTHRVFSRNSASSRAIPSNKLIAAIRENPAMFEQVGRANKGMTAQENCSDEEQDFFNMSWRALSSTALEWVQAWSPKIAKQVVNRALEPWMHMTVLATATDHRNFFKLRANPAAQPEFQVLAYRMLDAYLDSEPQLVEFGDWHLPGFDKDAGELIPIEERLIITTALACRASYSAFEEGIEPEDAKRIHDRGIENGHWSPFEHSAQSIDTDHPGAFEFYPWSNFDNPACTGGMGLSGWGQYRKMFTSRGEEGHVDNLPTILLTKPDWITL